MILYRASRNVPPHNRLTSAEDYEEALLSGYLPVGLYTKPNRKAIAYPGLNAGACAHHGVSVAAPAAPLRPRS